jgi:hypothetical protein
MILMREARKLAVLLVAGVVLAGCHQRPGTPVEPTYVEVDNRGFADMDIFVVDVGRKVRIGFAPGNHKSKMQIPPGVVGPGRSLSFLADPVGGNRQAVSQDLYIRRGETVTLTISP